MEYSNEELKNKIVELSVLINQRKYITACLEDELESTKLKLQENCVHTFVRESDNDCHSAKYYNVCSICNLIR